MTPTTYQLEADDRIANWRPLVHWLLAIPHMIVAQVLSQVALVVAVIGWFAILFTGTIPAGLAGVQCMVIRYTARAYSYALWLREPYPAFEFSTAADEPGGDPVRVGFQPEYEHRNRLTVGLRFLWIIPAAFFSVLLAIGGAVVAFLSFFAVLFTGRYPAGMREFMVKVARWSVWYYAYAYLLTDKYPPFALD